MPDPILNKRRNYQLWQSGAFGNKLRAWRTIDEWWTSGYSGAIVLRTLGSGGGPCRYNIPRQEVFAAFRELRTQGVPAEQIMLNEIAPDDAVVLQGEYLNELEDGFYYSRARLQMRYALKDVPEGALGLRARLLVREAMTPASHEDWQNLLIQYPNHILEVSIYDHCLGDLPHRNALVWEIRKY